MPHRLRLVLHEFFGLIWLLQGCVLFDQILPGIRDPACAGSHLLDENLVTGTRFNLSFAVTPLLQKRSAQFSARDSRINVVSRLRLSEHLDSLTKERLGTRPFLFSGVRASEVRRSDA